MKVVRCLDRQMSNEMAARLYSNTRATWRRTDSPSATCFITEVRTIRSNVPLWELNSSIAFQRAEPLGIPKTELRFKVCSPDFSVIGSVSHQYTVVSATDIKSPAGSGHAHSDDSVEAIYMMDMAAE
jgi:hypothetical protein